MTRILCDVDGVLAQFTEHLAAFFTRRGYPYEAEDFHSYALTSCMKRLEDARILQLAPGDREFCHTIPRYPGAQAFLGTLAQHAEAVTLVTAPWTGPHHTQAREEWIESILTPWWGKRVAFTWATTEERVNMPGDILIEDRAETTIAWAKTGRLAILMNRPWNRGIAGPRIVRAFSYAEALQYIFPGKAL